MPRYPIHGGSDPFSDDDDLTPTYGTRRKERKTPRPVAREGVAKQSFESNADVQRWLNEASEGEGARAPFEPEALVGRRDGAWVLSSLTQFYEQDLIADVVREVKSGKEATVFCCSPGEAAEDTLLAAKIYRPRMFRSLSNDAQYREGRVVRNEAGKQVKLTGKGVPSRASAKGRAFQVSSWIGYEYATQELAYQLGVRKQALSPSLPPRSRRPPPTASRAPHTATPYSLAATRPQPGPSH